MSHHSQHDGQMEIVNQVLETMLRAYMALDRGSWAKWLPTLAYSYNTSIHSSTRNSPYFLLYRFDPRRVLDLSVSGWDIPRPSHALSSSEDFIRELSLYRCNAHDAMASAQKSYAHYYNKNCRLERFTMGDQVLINPHFLELVKGKGTGSKLVQYLVGPFTVQECISPLVYRLKIPDTHSMNPVINIQHLRKYHPSSAAIPLSVSRPMLLDLKRSNLYASEKYKVKKIVAWWRKKGRLEFLIQWKGYGPEEES